MFQLEKGSSQNLPYLNISKQGVLPLASANIILDVGTPHMRIGEGHTLATSYDVLPIAAVLNGRAMLESTFTPQYSVRSHQHGLSTRSPALYVRACMLCMWSRTSPHSVYRRTLQH